MSKEIAYKNHEGSPPQPYCPDCNVALLISVDSPSPANPSGIKHICPICRTKWGYEDEKPGEVAGVTRELVLRMLSAARTQQERTAIRCLLGVISGCPESAVKLGEMFIKMQDEVRG